MGSGLRIEEIEIACDDGNITEPWLVLTHTPFAFRCFPYDEDSMLVKVTHVETGLKFPWGWNDLFTAVADIEQWWYSLPDTVRESWLALTKADDPMALRNSALPLKKVSDFDFVESG